MNDLSDIHLTSATFWQSALVAAVISVAILALLAWQVKRQQFRRLRWALAAAGALCWGGAGIILYQLFWDSYFQYFASGWLRSGGVLAIMLPVGAGMALLFHWIALRLPGSPVISFCLLGGLESILEHLWGFYRLKILDVPMLQGVSPASVLAFAIPEYIIYWGVVITLAAGLQKGWRLWKK
jgi:hypothetical protein